MKKLIHFLTRPLRLAAFCCFSILLPNQTMANTFTLIASNESTTPGATVCVDITTKNFTAIDGFQYDMSFDTDLLQFDSLTAINGDLPNLAYNELSPGLVRTLWNNWTLNGVTVADGSLLYSMCFTVQGNSGDLASVDFLTSNTIEIISANPGGPDFLLPWALVNGSVGIGSASVSTIALDDVCATTTTCATTDGSITITPSGGQTPYTFEWTGPGSFSSTTMNIQGLPPGIYTLTITDNIGAALTSNVMVGDNAAINVLGVVTDPLCSQTSGSIEIVFVSGGTAPYTYLWSTGETTMNLDNIPVGEYELEVTDANGCVGSAYYNVEEDEFGEVTAIVDDPTCGGGTGSINLTVTGGTGVYDYNWSNGDVAEDISNLPSGIYSVTIEDGNACTMTRTYTIGMVSNQFNHSYVCDPVTDLAELIVVDWLANEENTYEWSTGETTVGTQTTSIDNLSLGTYYVTITGNSSGCSTVYGPMEIDCSSTQSPNSCFMLNANSATGNNGDQVCVDISANGFSSIASMQYTISWDPTILSYTNVQNFNLESLAENNFGASQAPDGNLFISWVDLSLDGETVADGTVIYQICFDLIGAAGTSSTVIFTDNPVDIEVIAVPAITIGFSGSDGVISIGGGSADPLSVTNVCTTTPGCVSTNTGDADITISGGTAPYTYLWQDEFGDIVSTTEDLGGITEEGHYAVTVTDANGVEATAVATILINSPVVSVVSVDNVTCGADATGSIDVFIYGGTLPYSFAWSNGETTEDISNLLMDDYDLTVTDQEGCAVVLNTTVTGPDALLINLDELSCPSEAGGDGSVDIAVSGGVTPYAYIWSNGEFSEDVFNLEEGEFSMTVTDVTGCETSYFTYVGDCVWPGDTDTNGIVNNFDLLNIGLAYGATGSIRPNANISWVPQNSDNWAVSTPISMIDYKHIDTNGEGLIDDNDTMAISQNWGSTHNFMSTGSNFIDPPTDGLTVTAPFYVQPDTFIVNTTIGLPVILGDIGNTIEELYGIAFSVTYDPEVVVPGTAHMTFENSWIGILNSDMITIQRTFHADGRLDVAMVRTDGMNVIDGLGQIATFFITIEDDLVEPPGFTTTVDGMETVFGIENVRIITNIEEEIFVTPTPTTSTIEGISTGVNAFEENFDLQLFPNPVSDQLTINSADALIEQVTVYDIASRKIVDYNFAQSKEAVLETKQLGAGTYVVKIQTDKGLAVRRIVVFKNK